MGSTDQGNDPVGTTTRTAYDQDGRQQSGDNLAPRHPQGLCHRLEEHLHAPRDGPASRAPVRLAVSTISVVD